MALRIKAGGVTSVVEAKKPNVAIKNNGGTTSRDHAQVKPATAAEKLRPLTAVPVKTTNADHKDEEKKTTSGPVPPKTPKGGASNGLKSLIPTTAGDNEDPIERSLNERIKAGGVNQVVEKKTVATGAKPAQLKSVAKPPAEEKKAPAPVITAVPPKKESLKGSTAAAVASLPKVMKGKRKATEEEIEDP